MLWRINKKILVIFFLGLLLLAGLGYLSIGSTARLLEAAHWVSHTHEVIGRLESVLSDLKDMETAARGYVITTEARYLKPYWEGLDHLDSDTFELHKLLTDNESQQKNLALLVVLIDERKAILQEVIDVHRTRGLEESTRLIRTDRGRDVMERIRKHIAEMENREQVLLKQRQETEDNTLARTNTVLILGAGTAIILLTGSFWLLQRETVQRFQAEKENSQYLERIRDLYDGAPCGYHSLDKNAIFLEINETERDWLGYSREDIIGKLSFRDILTPQSRAIFKESFPKFIAEGQVNELELEISHQDGTRRTVLITAKAVFNPTGDYLSSHSTMFDITARKAAEQRIAELNAATERNALKLQTANNELEAFSYTVSHDLRAPLRHLDGFVKLLEKHHGDTFDERGRRYLRIISDSARQMGQLIDDLLTFARMGRSEMSVSQVDFNLLIQDVVRTFESECAGREIDWKIAHFPVVQGDTAMLRLVWLNLVGNAIKYTRPRPLARIEIGWENRGAETCFFIRDNGVGFDMNHAGKLFGVFQRLHRSEEFEGTGIGLASVRRIIYRHGGKTMAEGAVEEGAMVYFLLPKNLL